MGVISSKRADESTTTYRKGKAGPLLTLPLISNTGVKKTKKVKNVPLLNY
jgi:hypothetical protein